MVNGTTYDYPEIDDVEWGAEATDWAAAVTSGMLQKAGGLFQLLAEADFGTNYGLKSLYYKSRTANPADAGQIRFARADVINWRNEANGGNLSLGVSASDVLQFNGVDIQSAISVSDTTTIDLTLTGTTLSADIIAGSITNSLVSNSAAIAYSKLDLASSIVNADISNSAAIAYSKLALTGSIVNADISNSAAIAYSKLNLSGSIVNADVSASAAIDFSKLASLSSGNILVGNVSNVATSVAMSGDITISNAGVTAIGSNKVTNSMLAQVATATFKGRTTAGTGNVEDLTASQATALLSNFVGDSGSGGTKGLVPAPATGDAAAGKFLKADGSWTVPVGAGDVTGPASSTDNGFVRFNGTTGKVIKDSPATIVNADVDAAAAIAYSKLALTGSIVNADISNSAAIGLSKLATLTASRALVSNVSGVVSVATTTATEIGYLNGVTSAIQTQIDAKTDKSTLTTKGDIYVATGSATPARLGVGSDGQVLTADSSQSTGVKWATPATYAVNSMFNAYRGAAGTVSVTAGSPAEIRFDTVVTNLGSDYDGTTTGRYTAPTTGYYSFTANVQVIMGATAAADISVYFLVNGTGARRGVYFVDSLANNKTYTAIISKIIPLTAGDYVSVWVAATTQNVTVGNTGGSNENSAFCGYFIGS